MMNISVAMCTYNGSRFLGEQLRSITEQTRLPSEVTVCDDGSTDSTAAMVRAFADKAPFPVRFIRNEVTLGSTKNFEKAICLCSGDAIALCDQDDMWQRDKLKRLAQVLESEPDVGGVFSDALLIDDKSQTLAESLWERRRLTSQMQAVYSDPRAALLFLNRNPVAGATFLFRSRFIKQVTPTPSEWVHDAWIAFLIATLSRLRALPERLTSYRLHSMQQIGVGSTRLYSNIRVERHKAMASHDLLLKQWCSMTAKLATLPVDPLITHVAREKFDFSKLV